MSFPRITFEQWQAQVEEELQGKPFAKVLVDRAATSVPIQPLYTESASLDRTALLSPTTVSLLMRHRAPAALAAVRSDLAGGADGVWLEGASDEILAQLQEATVWLDVAPQGAIGPRWRTPLVISTLDVHDAGADAATEIACVLAMGIEQLNTGREICLRVAVGRDTFSELCKLRALRVCWRMLQTTVGQPASRVLVHAVCSSRTLTERDPWVNMLRVSTQLFAAMLGGADFVTPHAFDHALEASSALGRRLARNTGLVLRDEGMLGQVADPAGGAYFFDTLTDALAREAWRQFQQIEAEGGIAAAQASLAKKIDARWSEQRSRVAQRKMPILGVSEFANLAETLPSPVPRSHDSRSDAAPFEALRTQAERTHPEVVLLTLGSFAESRARVGFAANFFAAGGFSAREVTAPERARIVCLCGTDEHYAAEAPALAEALKALGCARVLLAGRPGALEASLRTSGVDDFIFVGCDAIAALSKLMEASNAAPHS